MATDCAQLEFQVIRKAVGDGGRLGSDGGAFKRAIGRGCEASGRKSDGGRYKRLLVKAIRAAGIAPDFGGVEPAENIAREMNLARAACAGRSFRRFVGGLDSVFCGRP